MELIEKIYNVVKAVPDDIQPYIDLYHICLTEQNTDPVKAGLYLEKLSDVIEAHMHISPTADFYELHHKVCIAGGQERFHLYILALEWEREPIAKFYPPRKKILRPLVEDLQSLTDDDLDMLAISMPPGTGKTTLAIFYLTWLAGKYPNDRMLTASHSNSFIRGVYDEYLRIVDINGDYCWHDVFNDVKMVSTNAKDCRIDFGKPKRFETLQFTSIGTGNAGLYRASRLLYCDDLVSGVEVAYSPDRLDKLWTTYNTDLRQRKIGDHCKELHIATRWSTGDVIGRLEENYGTSDRCKFVVLPALDENDVSNFDYDYGVGFTTQMYHEQRGIMDDVDWQALYMNNPIDRVGQLFAPDELRRFFDLPDGEPDAIYACCDTKDKGSDYCSMPVAYQYGRDYFIAKIVCNNGKPEVVDELLVQTLIKHNVKRARFESNSAGGRVAKDVQQELKKRGGITYIETKFTTANKETKIIADAPWVKEHCLFYDESVYPDKEYREAMKWLTGYSMNGKNKHDDVPDSMAQLAEYMQSLGGAEVTAMRRPW